MYLDKKDKAENFLFCHTNIFKKKEMHTIRFSSLFSLFAFYYPFQYKLDFESQKEIRIVLLILKNHANISV